jgi:putative intracellular protease/amidase
MAQATMPHLPKKALIAISSYHGPFYEDPHHTNTGLFYSEALHSYQVFKKAGFDVVFASETGEFGIDEHSTTPEFLNEEEMKIYKDPNSEFNVQLKHIKKASDLNPKEFGVFFASAGHAAVFDYETARGLQAIAEDVYARGGPVAAVSHGPSLFVGVKDPKTGKPIVDGRGVTGFSEESELILQVDHQFKKKHVRYVENALVSVGAKWHEPEPTPFHDFTIVDGLVVTGANPASATSTAQKAVELFNTASKT